ncbi:aminoglycoside phosphotransferase [Mycolicibacterium mucogenicum]|uniref:Aminoglycoside phosphotransferase n=2 Tax=Mycolicibacterium mucogenicum TaxID=56689 RepID=A0A1A3HFK1_MYCMU|nr:aminoglycoside phosphotransferase [Mycolicibacterium mucogenicum]
MDSRCLDGDLIEHVRPLGGGTQNFMLRFTRGGRDFVLRRGPEHLRASTNANLCREMQMLTALRGSAVPHPRLIAGCEDAEILNGSVFYLMEPVDGFNAATTLPELHAHDGNVRHAMGLAMVDAIAELATLDYRQVGLTDYGRPDGFLERQVPRWTAELDSYETHYGYDTLSLPGVRQVADWLQANLPAQWQPGILHGDFHLANVMFDYSSPIVAAVVDWEMSTIGDPLLDLGWLIATWPRPGETTGIAASALGAAGGLATVADLVERYANRSGRDVTHMRWYTVLACFKLGIVLDGTYARAGAGKAPSDVGERLHLLAVGLLERAVGLVQGDETL